MAADVDFEIIRLGNEGSSNSSVCVRRIDQYVVLSASTGLQAMQLLLLPSEAVTIGEQLIAAGKAEG